MPTRGYATGSHSGDRQSENRHVLLADALVYQLNLCFSVTRGRVTAPEITFSDTLRHFYHIWSTIPSWICFARSYSGSGTMIFAVTPGMEVDEITPKPPDDHND